MTRLQRRLSQAKREQRGVLMGFLPSAFPSVIGFAEAVDAAFAAGLDVLEVSLPGEAPDLDGPRIQDAVRRGTEKLPRVVDALVLAASTRRHDDDTIVVLARQAVVDAFGVDGFLDALETADIDGVILPELSLDDQLAIGMRAQARSIEPVLFLHRQEDLPVLASCDITNPVVYLQSADARTGDDFNPDKAAERLDELSEAMSGRDYWVCVGFGIRDGSNVSSVMVAGADGVIIGTQLVAAAEKGSDAVTALVDDAAGVLVRRSDLASVQRSRAVRAEEPR